VPSRSFTRILGPRLSKNMVIPLYKRCVDSRFIQNEHRACNKLHRSTRRTVSNRSTFCYFTALVSSYSKVLQITVHINLFF